MSYNYKFRAACKFHTTLGSGGVVMVIVHIHAKERKKKSHDSRASYTHERHFAHSSRLYAHEHLPVQLQAWSAPLLSLLMAKRQNWKWIHQSLLPYRKRKLLNPTSTIRFLSPQSFFPSRLNLWFRLCIALFAQCEIRPGYICLPSASPHRQQLSHTFLPRIWSANDTLRLGK